MKLKFIKYYLKYRDKIYNYFLYRLNFDREVAEDLTSEAFLRAFKKFADFDEKKASFSTWMFTVAHNLLVNYYRDKKSALSVEQMEMAGIQFKDEKYLNKLVNQLEIKLAIDKIMALPAEYAQVLIMRLVNQLEYKEIAEIIGKEEGNVRVIVSRGLDKLNQEFTS